jgi:heme exporter protein D
MDLGPHATFIVASYAAAAFILTLLIGWIVAESRALKRTLADFESCGITRRSDDRNVAPRKSGSNKSEAHSLA